MTGHNYFSVGIVSFALHGDSCYRLGNPEWKGVRNA